MKGLTPENYSYVKILWDYMRLNHSLQRSDVIILFGSSGDSYVTRAIELYQQGYASHIICSGHRNKYTGLIEAEQMSKILLSQGIPQSAIILEPYASNTAANIKYSFEICKQHNWDSVIIVHHPWSERRTYATAQRQRYRNRRPSCMMISSPNISIEEYDICNLLAQNRVGQLIGSLHRIKFYGAKGWLAHQEVPKRVVNAYLKLVPMGYKKYLIKGYPIW